MFRKYRIASKVRFTIFTSVLLIIIFMCLATVFGTSGVSGTSTESYRTVTVVSGDTLWSIAGAYSNNDTDIRKLVYEISRLNSLKADELTVGMQLMIPA